MANLQFSRSNAQPQALGTLILRAFDVNTVFARSLATSATDQCNLLCHVEQNKGAAFACNCDVNSAVAVEVAGADL